MKLETLQQVANKLEVTEEYFRHPPAAEVTDNGDVPEPGTIMLRKLDVARLEELLLAAERGGTSMPKSGTTRRESFWWSSKEPPRIFGGK